MTTAPTSTAESLFESYGPTGGAVLALAVGLGHLFYPGLGFATFASRLTTDPGLLVSDPRPVLFVVSGLGIAVGVVLSRNARVRTPYYVAGIAVSLTYVFGYIGWHLSGHGGFLPGREPLYHGLSPVENVLAHVSSEPGAALLIVAEIVLVVLLARLLQ